MELSKYYIAMNFGSPPEFSFVVQVDGYIYPERGIGIHIPDICVLPFNTPDNPHDARPWIITDLASGREITCGITQELAFDDYVTNYKSIVEECRKSDIYKQRCKKFNDAVLQAGRNEHAADINIRVR